MLRGIDENRKSLEWCGERNVLMEAEYKVISDLLCLTAGHKARKIENHLDDKLKNWRANPHLWLVRPASR